MGIWVEEINVWFKDILKLRDIVENNRELQMSNKPSLPFLNESSQ